MNTLLNPVIKLVPTLQYFNKFRNLNTEVDISVQYWTLITQSLYLNPRDIYFMNYRLIIYMVSFFIYVITF